MVQRSSRSGTEETHASTSGNGVSTDLGKPAPKKPRKSANGSTSKNVTAGQHGLGLSVVDPAAAVEEFEAERIDDAYFDHLKDSWFYLVKWRGYEESQNTWEPSAHCDGSKEHVNTFWKGRNLSLLLADAKIAETAPSAHFMKQYRELTESAGGQLESVRTEAARLGHVSFNVSVESEEAKSAARAVATESIQRWAGEMAAVVDGLGEAPIAVRNDVDVDPAPAFRYVRANVFGKRVTASAPELCCGAACRLDPGCGIGVEGCCLDARGVSVAFDADGRLLDSKAAVYECNSTCACAATCPSRRLHKGRQIAVTIFKTARKGWALKTDENVAKGAFVSEYVGEVIAASEAESRAIANEAEGATWLYDLDFVESSFVHFSIDAQHLGNAARFVNHSCEPNLVVRPVWSEQQDPFMPQLALFAIKNIAAGEELTLDYKIDAFDGESGERRRRVMQCYCGSRRCRRLI